MIHFAHPDSVPAGLFLAVVLAAGCSAGDDGRTRTVPGKNGLRLGSTNVLLITITSLNREAMGMFGSETDPSPYLDDLAKYGYTFHWTVTGSTDTQASLATLITGLHPKTMNLGSSEDPAPRRLHDRFVTLAERFAEEDYTTIGLTASPEASRLCNFNQGYQIYLDPSDFSAAKVSALLLNDRFLSTLKGRSDPSLPFFAHLVYTDCEEPYAIRISEPLKEKSDKPRSQREGAPYTRQLDYLDARIAGLADSLEKLGYEDTLVAITSDHGPIPTGKPGTRSMHQAVRTNTVLLAPWILYHPRLDSAWTRYYELVHIADFVPTILDLMGMPPSSETLYGQSRAGLIGGDRRSDPSPLAVVCDIGLGAAAVYEDEWKLMIEASPREDGGKAAEPRLYRYRRDPKDRKNLCQEHPEETQRLMKRYEQWKKEMTPRVSEAEIKLEAAELAAMRAMWDRIGSTAAPQPATSQPASEPGDRS